MPVSLQRNKTSVLSPAFGPIFSQVNRLDEAILYPSLRAKQSRVTIMGISLNLPSLPDKLYGGFDNVDRSSHGECVKRLKQISTNSQSPRHLFFHRANSGVLPGENEASGREA